MPAPIDTLIARLIASLEAKRKAVDEALQALQVLKDCAYLLPPEEAKHLLHDAYMQCDKREPADQGNLFPPHEPNCEVIEEEEEAKEEWARTYYARVAAYFLSVSNKDSTTSEIREATKLTRSALSAILYRTHGECFLRSTRPGYERMTIWRMEPVAYEAAKRKHISARQCRRPHNKDNEPPVRAAQSDPVDCVLGSSL